MRIGPTSFGGFSRQPLVVVQGPRGVEQMTLRKAEQLRKGGGGDEPEGPLSKILRLIQETLASFGF